MNKRLTRVLSLIMVLAMFLSVSVPAFALEDGWDREIKVIGDSSVLADDTAGDDENAADEGEPDEGWDREISAGEIREFNADPDNDDPDPKMELFTENEELGYSVTVEAPMGALPTLAELRAEPVEIENIIDAVGEVVEGEPNVLVALDISFWLGEDEIKPEEPVQVIITAPELEGRKNLTLVHLPEEDEPEAIELIDDEDLAFELGTNEICFQSKDFSVYAVIGDGEYARTAVEFISKGETIATMYVKNGDTAEEIEKIVYDPGVGTLAAGEQFLGWTLVENYNSSSERMTISQVRDYLLNLEITEGDTLGTVKFYAVIGKTITLTYLDDKNIAIQADSQQLIGSDTTVTLTVNANAPVIDSEHNFEGWNVASGAEYIVSAVNAAGEAVEAPYPNGTVLTISDDVTLSMFAPLGHWLVFNENGKGATYCAPRFLEATEVTERPRPDSEMIRNGYTFVDWFEPETDAEGKPIMQDGKVVLKSTPFVFGSTISQRTELYAKWAPASSAIFTVLIWRQNIACNGYDFAESVTLSGTPNTDITTAQVNSSGTLGENDAYAIINGTSYRGTDGEYEKNPETASPYCGFHLQEITYGPNGKNINPEGNTVVNVYYDRNEYVLTFRADVEESYTPVEEPDWDAWSNEEIAYYFDDPAGNKREVAVRFQDGSVAYNIGSTSTYYLDTNYAAYYYAVSNNNGNLSFSPMRYQNRTWQVYNGSNWVNYYRYDYTTIVMASNSTSPTIYTRQEGGSNQVVKTITAKFGQDISENFPIVGDNGTEYDNGERWKPQTNLAGWTEVMVYIDTMPSTNVTFVINVATRPLKTINYYVEALPGQEDQVNAPGALFDTSNNSVTTDKKFVLYKSIDARYNGVTIEDLVALPGFTLIGADSKKDGSGFWIYSTTQDGTLNLYYKRDLYPITYQDGIYVDGNNNPVDEPKEPGFGQSADLMFGSDITSYNKGGTNYNQPTKDGYVFEGWFLDTNGSSPATFSTMPRGGITVYAKWRQIQYRVFLHPNAGTDSTLSWGDEGRVDEHGNPAPQQMNFRITIGGKISVPDGTRNEYKFLGWYRDASFTQVFNADAFVLNETTVPETPAYDKSEDFTDVMDKWGNGATTNSDVNRFWITRKLDLYARWSAVLNGADGIGVIYDANGGKNPPSDTTLYIDTASAVAQAACTAPAGKVFKYWVVQTWDADQGKYVDTTTTVEPGAQFMIQRSLARQEAKPDNTETHPSYTYTIQLRAEYGEPEVETPTSITWYSNVQDIAGLKMTESKFVVKGTKSEYTDKGYFFTDDKNAAGEDLKINEAVDIRTFDTFAYPGYTFLGWAKLDQAGDPNAVITTLDQIDPENLFLKWVPATEDEEAHYISKVNGNWLTVTQVAADERNPHQMLVAVWSGEFKIYHSGLASDAEGVEETIAITKDILDENGKFNLAEKTTSGTLYGGYYLASGVVLPAAENDVVPAYNGANWTWNTAETVSGLAMVPVAGETYYIKEVPADMYLQPYFHFTYHKSDLTLSTAWLITDIDDSMYKETGFVIIDANNKANVCSSLTVQNKVGGASVKLEANTIFRAKGVQKGYLGYLEVFNGGVPTLMQPGNRVVQYWVTPDNLIVTGTTARSYNDLSNRDAAKSSVESTAIESTIAEFSSPAPAGDAVQP